MAREQNVSKLSKSILEMKFMKRTKEKVEKELEDAEGREMYSHEITAEMRQGAGSFVIEPSFVPCEDLLVGRLSYRGMNPEIERIMELEYAEANPSTVQETDVTDKEMAAFYNPLVDTMNSKFKVKNQRKFEQSEDSKNHKRRHSPDTPKSFKKNKNNHGKDSSAPEHKSKKARFMKPSED